MDCSLPGSSVHGDSPRKNTGMGCCALLQGIFPTQGSDSPNLSLYSGPIPAPLGLDNKFRLPWSEQWRLGWGSWQLFLSWVSEGTTLRPALSPWPGSPTPLLSQVSQGGREEPCLLHHPGWKSQLWCQELGETTG